MNEKDIKRFIHGDKYLKSLLRLQLEEEINNLNLWLPEYKQYYDVNPGDTRIGVLIQNGEERLKILEMLLKDDNRKEKRRM